MFPRVAALSQSCSGRRDLNEDAATATVKEEKMSEQVTLADSALIHVERTVHDSVRINR